MEYQDYYKTLGVPRTAGQAEIRKAFRKLAREHHPDRNPGNPEAEKRFKAVNEANEVLSDPAKRKQYDALGANWEAFSRSGAGRGGAGDPFGPGGPFAGFQAAGGFPGGGFQGAGEPGVRFEFHGDASGFSDFFRTFFGGGGGAARGGATREETTTGGHGNRRESAGAFDDILSRLRFESASGGPGATSDPFRAGADPFRAGSDPVGAQFASTNGGRRTPEPVEAEVEVSLEEAYHGTQRLVEVDGKRLEVQVPRGVDTGSRIRLRGKGGGRGNEARDLHLVTRVKPHHVFSRTGADLTRELPVTLREALLGAEVPVGTLKGRVVLTLPAGTQAGRTFRLAGQGMPMLKGTGYGDLYVRIKVVLPTHLSDEARRAAEAFLDKVEQADPRAQA